MTIAKLVVSHEILTGNLFSEGGYDEEKSAHNLAELAGRIMSEYLQGEYPEAEIFVDVAIFSESRRARPVEIAAYTAENEAIGGSGMRQLQERVTEALVQGTADLSWAVALSERP